MNHFSLIHKSFFFTVLMLVTANLLAQDMSKKEIKQQQKQLAFEKTKKIILSKNFEFKGDWMYSASGQRVNLDNRGKTLKIQGDNAQADLAFIGDARNLSPNSSLAISFNSLMSNYKLKENTKKLKYLIQFKVKADNDSYDITMDVDSEGTTTLIISSFNKSVMRYTGITKPLRDNE